MFPLQSPLIHSILTWSIKSTRTDSIQPHLHQVEKTNETFQQGVPSSQTRRTEQKANIVHLVEAKARIAVDDSQVSSRVGIPVTICVTLGWLLFLNLQPSNSSFGAISSWVLLVGVIRWCIIRLL